jgi:PAS domain S-box-containing protein
VRYRTGNGGETAYVNPFMPAIAFEGRYLAVGDAFGPGRPHVGNGTRRPIAFGINRCIPAMINRRFSRLSAFSVPRLHIGIVVFAVLLIGALWIAVAQVVAVERESAVQAAVARGDDLAVAFEHYAIRTIESADMALQDLVQEAVPASGKFSLAHFQSDYSIEKSAFIDVILADASGNAISIARHGKPAVAPNVADQQHFAVHVKRDSGTFFVGMTIEDPIAGKYVIPVTRRITNADGTFGGVAMAMIEPARFTDVFGSVGLHHLDAVLLTGVDGIIRVRLQGSQLSWGANTTGSVLFAEQALRPNGHYLTKGKVDGVSRYFSYRTLRDFQVIAVVGIAQSDALAGFVLRRQRYWEAAALASLVIAGFTAALLFALIARQRATARLAQDHARYAATFSGVPVGIARSDLAGHFLETNPALHDILGYSSDALLGRRFTEITCPEDVAALTELHRSAMNRLQLQPIRVEVRLVKSDGSLAWCLLTASLVRDGSDASSYLVTAVKDITERKLAESALADLSERTARRERILSTMLSSMSDFAFMFDREGRFLFVNQPLLDMWGIPLEGAVGKNFADLGYTEEMAAKLQRQVQQVFETNRSVTDETPYTSPSGQEGYYEYIFSPVVAANGAVEFVAGSSRDFTERKRAELAVRESEVKFRQLAETIDDAFWIRSPDLARVDYVSPAFARIWGRSVASLYADPKQWPEYILAEDRERVLATGSRALQRGEDELEMEYRIVRPDGEIRWIRSRAFSIRDAAGKVVRLAGVASDVTELKRVMQDLLELNASLEQRVEERTQELERANRAKSTFLATVSHEIRTPLNGVIGMLELLSLTKLDAQQRTRIEVVRQSSRSLTRIIDDILDYSKIEAGKLAIHSEVASVEAAVHAAIGLYTGAADSKGISLTSVVDERIGPAHRFDPHRLQQILNNCVSNALKFTEKGHVELRAESVEQAAGIQAILFTIADTGIGISPEDQKRLFQPFTQIEATSTRRFGGTGLGLSICRQLAEMMGGTIEVESKRGVGTTFSLTLVFPTADAAQLPPQRESPPVEPAMPKLDSRVAPGVEQAVAEGTLVLVVDDHSVNRMVLTQQMEACGYAVETAENGLEGLDKWRSGRYGLVLADCNMPVMDGYEMVREIRAAEALSGAKRTPVIACTANVMEGEAERTFAAGMDDYLSKPLELHDVLRKMACWLPLPGPRGPEVQAPAPGVSRPASTASGQAVDAVVLAALSRGNASTQRELIALFRSVNDQDSIDLKRLVSRQDGEATKSTAHRIKGASLMLGAFRLAALAAQIEAAGHGQDWPEVAIAMPPFEAELARVNTFLDSL